MAKEKLVRLLVDAGRLITLDGKVVEPKKFFPPKTYAIDDNDKYTPETKARVLLNLNKDLREANAFVIGSGFQERLVSFNSFTFYQI